MYLSPTIPVYSLASRGLSNLNDYSLQSLDVPSTESHLTNNSDYSSYPNFYPLPRNYTVYDLIKRDNPLFCSYVDRAKLTSFYSDRSNNLTLFVPMEDTFFSIQDCKIRDTLLYCTVPSKILLEEFNLSRYRIETCYEYDTLLVDGGPIDITINRKSKVVSGNYEASNGVVHYVDRLLTPYCYM